MTETRGFPQVKPIKSLIIGYGSAGKRHASVLKEVGHEVAVRTSQECEYPKDIRPDYVVIASVTNHHARELFLLEKTGFKGKCLVEKPLFLNSDENLDVSFPVYVGYQMRFLTIIQMLKKALEGAEIYSSHIYAGQQLGLWNGTYHTSKNKGGGVLRDYSHELDLIGYLFGDFAVQKEVRGGGVLTYQDVFAGILTSKKCPLISLQLNYFDTRGRREWIINTSRGTFHLDLSALTLNGEKVPCDDPTKLMHESILSDAKEACTFAEGLAINRLIDGIEA